MFLQSEYPEATWTEISTKAWLASRALDYLLDRKYGYNVADGASSEGMPMGFHRNAFGIGIIGHSRYGKQSLIAAAFDDRITSVVARSPGSPGSCASRFTSRNCVYEVNQSSAMWFGVSMKHERYGKRKANRRR